MAFIVVGDKGDGVVDSPEAVGTKVNLEYSTKVNLEYRVYFLLLFLRLQDIGFSSLVCSF